MELSLMLGRWDLLLDFFEAHPEPTDTDFVEKLFKNFETDRLTGYATSARYIDDFGRLFETIEAELDPADRKKLGRFLASFCPYVGEDGGGRYPVPMDTDIDISRWFYSAMSPATLRELSRLPSRIDRDTLRLLVHGALDDFLGFIDLWARAYQRAAEKDLGAVVHLG